MPMINYILAVIWFLLRIDTSFKTERGSQSIKIDCFNSAFDFSFIIFNRVILFAINDELLITLTSKKSIAI